MLIVLVGFALSALFLWLAVRNADLAAVRRVLGHARVELVIPAVAAYGCGYVLQAARWRRISNAPQLSLRRFYGMVLGGLACNNVLPIRIGELLRARWLSRDAPMSGGRALGSVALDRVCDVVTLALFLAIGLQAVAGAEWLVRLVVSAVIAILVIAGALIGARLYTARAKRDRRSRGRVRQLARDTVEMLAEPVGRRRVAVWMGLTIGAWTLGAVAVTLVGRSIGIEFTPIEAVFVTAALALGVAIPSSPGYVGTYQWLGVASLGLLDVPLEEALAFTILLQATWYIPTTLAGGAVLGVRALRGRVAGPAPAKS